jgi:copper homeostasis protein (lipoprotein)
MLNKSSRLAVIGLVFTVLAAAQDLKVPATFRGTVPCADCSGIQKTLTLRDDGLFFLRDRYLGKPGKPSWNIGTWESLEGGQKIVLRLPAENLYFQAEGASLSMLDREGKKFASGLNYTLKRSPNLLVPAEPILFGGMFVYLADAASLADCRVENRRFPVAGGKEYLKLERLYTEKRPGPGEPLYVSFLGRLKPNPMGEGPKEAISVESGVQVFPGRTCTALSGSASKESFAGKWLLSEINGAAPNGEAWIEVDAANRRVAGNNGCNRITGGYEPAGEAINFKGFAGTRMACPGSAMQLEAAFNKAMDNATARIVGGTLEVLQQGNVVARFRRESAVAAAASPGAAQLAGKWILKELNGAPPAVDKAFLQFDPAAKRISGNSGCNTITGSYAETATGIKPGQLASTMMACMGPGMEMETTLGKALNGSELRLTGGVLEVVKGGQVLAKYQKEGSAMASSVSGKWVLQEINGAPPSGGRGDVFFELDPATKRVSGSSGCNRMMGTYEEEAGSFTFGRMAGTRMACPGDAMALEAAVLKAFEAKGRISGNTFELIQDGRVMARFTRQ